MGAHFCRHSCLLPWRTSPGDLPRVPNHVNYDCAARKAPKNNAICRLVSCHRRPSRHIDDTLLKPSEKTDDVTSPLTITDLPTEVIIKIFSYLSPPTLHNDVSRVCKKFNTILSCDFLWMQYYCRRNSILPNTEYPYLDHIGMYSEKWRTGADTSWRDLCMSTENAKIRWFDDTRARTLSVAETTNVVHLMNGGYCITGSRERSIGVWNYAENGDCHITPNAHSGWLSSLCTLDNNIVSCGWDAFVKIWSVRDNLEQINSYCLNMAIMAVDCQPRMIAACTFPELILIDPRIGRCDGFKRFKIKEGSVVQLSFWENSIVMASRSRCLMQFDLRMGRTCVTKLIQTISPPRTMSVLDGIVYVGDNRGYVYLYDLHNNLEQLDKFTMCESKAQIRALIPRTGYMIVGSSDGELKAVHSVQDPEGIKVLRTQQCPGEVSCGHFKENTLAILNGTIGLVTVYPP